MKKSKAVYVPFVIWLLIFVLIPLGLVVYYSLTGLDGKLTINNFRELTDPVYLSYLVRSLRLAVIATLICLAVGYPTALVLSVGMLKNKVVWLVLVIAPMWMNFLLRTYAWQVILEDSGIVNMLLERMGFGRLHLINTEGAVLFGMVYDLLPFMIFPIFNALSKIPKNMLEASSDLGAGWFTTFRRIVLPLSVPGIVSGITMVFVPGVTTFVISQYLGGGMCNLIGDVIENLFNGTSGNWHLGSALSVIVMAVILICMGFVNRASDDEEGGVMNL